MTRGAQEIGRRIAHAGMRLSQLSLHHEGVVWAGTSLIVLAALLGMLADPTELVAPVSAAFGLLVMLGALWQQSRRHRVHEAALQDCRLLLAKNSDLLDTTLEHMALGLVVTSPGGEVALFSRRAAELLELPPATMRDSTDFAASMAVQDRRSEDWRGERLDQLAATSGDGEIRIIEPQTRYERVRPDGVVLAITGTPLPGGGTVWTLADITAQKQAEKQVAHHAYHDDLTQLFNRVRVRERLEQSIADAQRSGTGLAVMYLGLDRLKLVNDARGHALGDRLLIEAASRMQAAMREDDTVGRLGGDEFAIVFPGVTTVEDAQRSAQRVAAVIRKPYELDGAVSRIDVSIGVALFPEDGNTAEQLLQRADSALYRAKSSGRGQVAYYEPQTEPADADAEILEQDLAHALELDQFELVYQPIFDAATGSPLAFEALLRWRHPTRGVLFPADFLSLAERTGVIEKLGRWVLQTACTEAATWAMPVRLAINLSPMQFLSRDFEDQVIETLHRSGLAPERLDLEVTEGVLLEHSQQVLATMMSLRTLGVGLVLDDFGTANSSLSFLRDFPFQQIKIDCSFVATMLTDASAMTIVRMVVDMGAALRLAVVAEGVEQQVELDALRQMGCTQVQGYLLSRPLTPERTREYLWQATRRTDSVGLLLGAR